MTWNPFTLAELEELITIDLEECSEEEKSYFAQVRIAPSKWSQDPWGVEGGGFWVLGIDGNRVLWYNDIELGFNVSEFLSRGIIPDDAYFCNQDSLGIALQSLALGRSGGFGSPLAVPDS